VAESFLNAEAPDGWRAKKRETPCTHRALAVSDVAGERLPVGESTIRTLIPEGVDGSQEPRKSGAQRET